MEDRLKEILANDRVWERLRSKKLVSAVNLTDAARRAGDYSLTEYQAATAALRAGRATASAERAPVVVVSRHEEAIILLENRPSLLVRKHRFEVPKSAEWAQPITASRALLEERLPSIGRLEVDDGSGTRPGGTAWVIADGVLATNRHVAEKFAAKKDGVFRFLASFQPGRSYRVRIDFREEYGEEEEFEVRVKEIIFVEEPDRNLPDIAFLRLEPDARLPPPIPLLSSPPRVQSRLVVIGYPTYDTRYGLEALEAANNVFGPIYDMKRLSPGLLIGAEEADWFFRHDATTLGGNSGSVVLDMETGLAVGMHFKGEFRRANYAVKASVLAEYAKRHGVNIVLRETLPPAPAVAPPPDGVEEAPVESYADREGFREESFLEDGLAVKRPRLTAALEADVMHPISAEGTDGYVVHYTNFSLVMCRSRRVCFYSAVNINGKDSVSIRGRRPRWRKDRRLSWEIQIQDECYGEERHGKFSRGHMTRREDPNWGPKATKANDDTFHVTNACPQMQPFNAGIWLGLEDYALEHARQDQMRICVFTGPVFGANDPVYFGVKVPEWFWKIIAFIHDETGELTATGYKMDQRDVLPGEEFVYGRHGTYQTSLKEIEALTRLSFGELAERDPYRVVEEAPATPLLSFDQVRFT